MSRIIRIRVPVAKRILDLGCGSGWVLAEAQVDGNPLRVGIDYSPESLAGRGVPALDPDRANPIHKVLGDGLHLPFSAASFDVVVGHVSMPYMNTRAAFREIYRVLAPGGSFLLTFHCFYYLRQRLFKSLLSAHWKDVAYMLYVGTNGLLNHFNLPQTQVWWKPSAFETVSTQRGVYMAASRVGFTGISSDRRAEWFFHMAGQKPSEGGIEMPPPEVIYRNSNPL